MVTSTRAAGRQIDINGASLYVEEQGTGDPLVLVHGGFVSSAMWAGVAPLLAAQYRVITFDSRGHGRSTNPGGTLLYEQFADDTAALIEALELDRPFVGGWSDGGEAALQFGSRHPGRARGLIAGGTSLELGTEAAKAQMRAMFHVNDDGVIDFDAFVTDWAQTLLPMMRQSHPHGEQQWQTIVQQTVTMWLAYPSLTHEQFARIDAPALVVVGDRDELISVEEVVKLYRWLPNAELAILPGSTHMRPIFEPATFVGAVLDFLHRH